MKNDMDLLQLKTLAETWAVPYLENEKLIEEIVVENPTMLDLEKYLVVYAPNFQNEPHPFIHVPQKFSTQYLRLLVKFDLPHEYRESRLATALFDQMVATENFKGLRMLFEHGFQITQEVKSLLILNHLESILMASTESGYELDFVFLRQMRNTPLFDGFSLHNHLEFCKYIDDYFVPSLQELFPNIDVKMQIYQEFDTTIQNNNL